VARRSAQMSGFWDWFKPKQQSQPGGAPPPVHVDLYAILGVPPNATQEQIKHAFRDQAMKFHPDRNPGDALAEQKYTEISAAYAVLGDEAQRAAYDRRRPAPPPQRGGGGIIPRPGGQQEASQAPAPPQKLQKRLEPKSMIEHMFGVAKEEPPSQGSLFDILSPGKPAAPPARIPVPGTPFAALNPSAGRIPVMPGVDVPDDNELWHIVQHWPLDFIFEVARADRHSPEFRKAGAMALDVLGGGGSTSAEFDIADLFGLDKYQVNEVVKAKGRDALFVNVLHPLFSRVTAMLDRLKPVDVPGSFFLDWDPTGKMIELVYAENVGRR